MEPNCSGKDRRWRADYLNTLQERKKWRREKENVKIGQLVLLVNENAPPAACALGRIIELRKSRDNLVRNVVEKTSTSTFVRPVQKICVVPVEIDKLEV